MAIQKPSVGLSVYGVGALEPSLDKQGPLWSCPPGFAYQTAALACASTCFAMSVSSK